MRKIVQKSNINWSPELKQSEKPIQNRKEDNSRKVAGEKIKNDIGVMQILTADNNKRFAKQTSQKKNITPFIVSYQEVLSSLED